MKAIALVFNHHIFRYIFSGGMGAITNLGLLFILTEFAGLYYVVSGIIAFSCSVVVSFIMQKKWTFQDHATHDTHMKFGIFLAVALFNLLANTTFLYFFTDYLKFHYLISQIIAGGIVAVWSYFIYKKVFKKAISEGVIM